MRNPPLSQSEERRGGKEWRYWRDWSSDVCSSDLYATHVESKTRSPACTVGGCRATVDRSQRAQPGAHRLVVRVGVHALRVRRRAHNRPPTGSSSPCGTRRCPNPKSVVEGKSGDIGVTGVQTCALPISTQRTSSRRPVRQHARWAAVGRRLTDRSAPNQVRTGLLYGWASTPCASAGGRTTDRLRDRPRDAEPDVVPIRRASWRERVEILA